MAEPITPEQNAAMLAEAERHQREFDEWAQGVLSGERPAEGVERDAQRAGFKAGQARVDDATVSRMCRDYTARERVAFAVGFGEGRALPATDPNAPPARPPADVLRMAREAREARA